MVQPEMETAGANRGDIGNGEPIPREHATGLRLELRRQKSLGGLALVERCLK